MEEERKEMKGRKGKRKGNREEHRERGKKE
jgi:hypothetical protein